MSNSTDQPEPSLRDGRELYEEVESLFNLRISSSGNDIGILFAGEEKDRVWMDYEVFAKLRESIEALVQSHQPKQPTDRNVGNPQPVVGDEINAILYRFADYIRHHDRTGLGGPDNQNTIRNELQAHTDAAVKETEQQSEAIGRVDEWLRLDKVVGFDKKRHPAVYKLQLPLAYVQARTKELRELVARLTKGGE